MHYKYMDMALEQARIAYGKNEVPVGAIIVYNNKVISMTHNLRESTANPLAHAEVEAIKEAAEYLGSWNLSGCTLYVTVEPCPMCAGAILQTQLTHVVYGVTEPNSGSLGTIVDLSKENYNHKLKVTRGIREKESRNIMKDFFKKKRSESIKVRRISNDEMDEYRSIRKTVFVDEQNVDINIEYDLYDTPDHNEVTHVGAFINNKMVGTMRLIDKRPKLIIGRLAVLKENRKDGVGSALLRYADKQAANNGFDIQELGAQLSAMAFYKKIGFTEYGDVFLDANIEHKMMNKINKSDGQ